MSYLGNTPTQQNFVAGADQFSGTGSQTVFTLSRVVNTVFDIFVTVSNVPQDPFTAYTISGNTLTFDSAPPSGTNNIDVVYHATNVQTFVPSPGVSPSVGNLNFIGTGNRITGDFSNATVTSRVLFQTSTADSVSNISVIPNGTSTSTAFTAYNNSNPTDAGLIQIASLSTDNRITSGRASGLGTLLPMTFYVGNAERMRVDTSGNLQFNSGYGSVATAYGCRAWVNFNGTGTVAIRASGNVTSITDNNTGDYTVNFTTAMPDANYATTASPGDNGGYTCTPYSQTTASVRLTTRISATGAVADISQVHIAIFR